MKSPFITLLTLFMVVTLFGQKTEYTTLLIPDSLKTDANTIIRENSIYITIKSTDKQIIKRKRVATILNKSGNKNLNLHQYYDDDTKILKLYAKVYDAFGNELKKYSKSKFTDISAVDGSTLYSDSRIKYIDYTPTSYPYTVVFESETQNTSTGFIPKWSPVEGYGISIQKSIYQLHNPQNIPLRKKEKSFNGFNISNTSNGNNLKYELTNQPAMKYERGSLAFYEIMPHLLVALNNFSLKGVAGSGSNWKEFGKWMNDKLLAGRQTLDEATIAKVNDLVKDAKTDIEKAKIVYNFMQNRTRYISVQVGIGGWEPISAKEVDKAGYGDCKGLTNYTKALLDAVGVKSHYTVVYAQNRRDIDSNFSSLQGNHVILNIPNKGNDVWLECTSQTIPFGFLGDFTDDRNVLVITDEGGLIKRTPAYKNETNLQTLKASITLNEKGDLTASFNRSSEGTQYDDKLKFDRKSEKELIKYYRTNTWDYNNNLEINSVILNNNKDNVTFSEDIKANITNYASINDKEYLFRLNAFNKFEYIPKRYRNRQQSFKIPRGFVDKDVVTYKIPSGFSMGDSFPNKELNTKFGTYKITTKKVDDTTIEYQRKLSLKDGIYPKEDYKKYRKFLKSVNKYDNIRISLTKK